MKTKSFLIAALVGGFTLHVLATWVAPSGIVWYFDPPVKFGVSCSEAVSWSLERFRTIQLIAFGIGVPVGVASYFMFQKKSSKGV